MADRFVAIVVNVNYWSRKIGRCDDHGERPHGIPCNWELEVGDATTKRNPLIRGGTICNDIAGNVY